MSFGVLLRHFRITKGLTQEELAHKAGLSAHGISDLERGTRTHPYEATIRSLAAALGLNDRQLRELRAASRGHHDPGSEGVDGATQARPGLLRSRSRTTFVGRQQEVQEVLRSLERTNLLTLTGTGGVGKTRLALRIAELVERGGLRVFSVALASLADASLLEHTVLTALGGRAAPHQPLAEAVVACLAGMRTLLILDNCEHLLDRCAALVDYILNSCPDVQVLATSRELLGIAGEVVWRVPSLAVPDTDRPCVADANQYAAVRLLVDRAGQVRPGFTLTEDNVESVVQVCKRLDGIPLAIEFAAARIRHLSVAEVAAQLDDRFRILIDGGRTHDHARHQTMRAALDWSYDLLVQSERDLLHRLSVFAGGCTLEAAKAVCGGGGIDHDRVMELLGSLADKSLIVVEERGGRARFRLLETVRAYATERLGPAEVAELHRRHRGWFADIAERIDSGLLDSRQIAHLEEDYDNFRVALRSSIAQGEYEVGLRLGVALWLFWHMRGLYAEGAAWLTELVAVSADAPPTPARAAALHWAAHLRYVQGHPQGASALLAQSEDVSLRADYDRGLAMCGLIRGIMARDLGHAAEAHAQYARALGRLRQADDWSWQVVILTSFGHALCDEGDTRFAESVALKALRIARTHGHVYGVGRARYILGRVAAARGELRAAQQHLEAAVDDQRQLPFVQGVVWALVCLGPVLLAQGEPNRARDALAESLTLAQASGQQLCVAQGLETGTELLAVSDPEAAVQCAAVARVIREVLGAPSPPNIRERLEVCLKRSRQLLGDEGWNAAWVGGTALSVKEACARVANARFKASEPVCRAIGPEPPEGTFSKSNQDGLTPREREVAMLVAEGLTNAEVANRLVIGERTVETHIKHLHQKLGVTSRTQLVAWMISGARTGTSSRAGVGDQQNRTTEFDRRVGGTRARRSD
jgi:non-specific serine/threonine protein kinase